RVGLGGQVVEDRARGRDDLVRRQRVDRDVVVVELGRQAGRKSLDRGLAHAVDGAAATAPGRWRDLGMDGCDRGDVEYPAATLRAHAGQHELRQVERRRYLHVKHQLVLLGSEVLDPPEVGHGGVVHADVGGTELRYRLGDQPLAVFWPGQVG